MKIDDNRIHAFVQQASRLAETYEIVLLTSNDSMTTNVTDYSGYSVKAEFLSNEDEEKIVRSLEKIGFSVHKFCNEEDFISCIAEGWHNQRNIIVVNSAQKGIKIGRKSLIPAVCDLYNIPYVGSNPYVVSLGRDKYRCGCILAQNGIPVPKAWLYQEHGGWYHGPPDISEPIIIKPNYEASSIGIDTGYISRSHAAEQKARELARIYCQEVIAEEFISGYEVEVPVIVSAGASMVFFPVGISMGNHRKIGDRILDYSIRSQDAYNHYDFTQESPDLAKELLNTAACTAQMLNINGFGRVDFRVSEYDNIYVTDVSTNPHYTENSSFEFVFSQLGFGYDELIASMIAASINEVGI